MVHALKQVINSVVKTVSRLPSWTIDKENKKKARKEGIVEFSYNGNSSWNSKYSGSYLLFSDFVVLDTEIRLINNPSCTYLKTKSINYKCVILTIKDKLVDVYCPVEPDFFKELYLHQDKYDISSNKNVINGKFVLAKGLLYLACSC